MLDLGKTPCLCYKDLADDIDEMIHVEFSLCMLSLIGLDRWYAISVLGWQLDTDLGSNHHYHFHTSNGFVVRPTDYSIKMMLYGY